MAYLWEQRWDSYRNSDANRQNSEARKPPLADRRHFGRDTANQRGGVLPEHWKTSIFDQCLLGVHPLVAPLRHELPSMPKHQQ